MTERVEDPILDELDGRGPIGRAALAEAVGVTPDKVSNALYGLKQLGLVVPVGNGLWASCTEPKAHLELAPKLPEGEGRVRVKRNGNGSKPAPVASPQEPEPDLTPATAPEPPLTRVPFDDLAPRRHVVDVEALRGELFNAAGAVANALQAWRRADPFGSHLERVQILLEVASDHLSELEP